MLKAALANVQRNYEALLIYIAISTSYFTIRVLVEKFLIGKMDIQSLEDSQKLYLVIAGMLTAFVIAIAQTLAFTRMAKDIDRPLWYIEPGFPPLFRYCSFWFTLNFINAAAFLLIAISHLNNDAKISLDILRSIFEIYIIPFGACVMFYGNTTRQELSQALNTMLLQFPRFLLVGFLVFIAYGFLKSLAWEVDPMASPIIRIIEAYIDCLIFAYAFEICKLNREEEENSDDMDF